MSYLNSFSVMGNCKATTIDCNTSVVTWSSKKKFHVCLSAELFDPSILAKTYWSILKTFVDVKLVPFISSLLVNGKFVTDFLEKANIFNDLFSQQCQPIFDIGN